MKETFVHVSDLHYRENWPEEIGQIEKYFFEDLKKQVEGTTKPHLIFSGDLVQAGGNSESYSKFLESFGNSFDALNIPKNRRIIVPGNHDISQSVAKNQSLLIPALKNCESEEDFNYRIWPQIEAGVVKKFTEFLSFEKNFSSQSKFSETIGGFGISVNSNIGVYVLNSAICSYGGAVDTNNDKINDKKLLGILTKDLNEWLKTSNHTFKILVLHHPLSWLAPWASKELNILIQKNFQLVTSGHEHTQDNFAQERSGSSTVMVEAPALFTRKSETLGYSIFEIDPANMTVSIEYRQWVPLKKMFVLGTSFTGNDTGSEVFQLARDANLTEQNENLVSGSLKTALRKNLARSLQCYDKTNPSWVDRQLSLVAETNSTSKTVTFNEDEVIINGADAIIKAPAEFGLTVVGRRIAYIAFEKEKKYFVVIDALHTQPHETALVESVETSASADNVLPAQVRGIIIDNWISHDGRHIRIANNLKKKYPDIQLIFLSKIALNSNSAEENSEKLKMDLTVYFMWALRREAIASLITEYVDSSDLPDADTVIQRVVDDMDSLSMPRTPLHCINLLKSNEYLFDESPVNRTEVLERVLRMLFYQYQGIPQYSTKPDLKDCQFSLGKFCETLLREERSTFNKNECIKAVETYCSGKGISLDATTLFDILVREKILVFRGGDYRFRYIYWLHFFAAHRMGHSIDFFDFVLSKQRYAQCPELIEFYSGIDRHRADLLERLTMDLKSMNDQVTERSKIKEDFDPYPNLKWEVSDEQLTVIENEISKSAEESTLPREIKNQLADRNYDRTRAYDQEMKTFLDDVTFGKTVKAMNAASRALRNSEHVDKPIKMSFLNEIMRTWKKMIQIGVMLVPSISSKGGAAFEDFGFYLGGGWPADISPQEKMMSILSNIPLSISRQFHRDLFSHKNGSLYMEYANKQQDHLPKLLSHHLLMLQRPIGWQGQVKKYIDSMERSDFPLEDIQGLARMQRVEYFLTEEDSNALRDIMARVLIKHQLGRSKPGKKLIEKAVSQIKDDEAETSITEE
jgi:predicted phosphodiesterase